MDPSRTITQTHERRSGPGKGQPYLFLTLRCDHPLEGGARFSFQGADQVSVGRGGALQVERQQGETSSIRISLPDGRMSSRHARLQRVLGAWMIEDAGSKNGTFVDGKRVTTSPLADGALVELGHSFFVFREALPRAEPALLEQRALKPLARGMATLSPAFALELERVATFAHSQVPVLVSGQTGTGKELIASAIHQLSGRPGPFVAVNCGAIAPNLVESELFGYRKGAFSGALEDRPGLVRSSEHGTLLLDEIGDLPVAAQAALLRVLQENEVLPVGGTRPVKVDLRVGAATHRERGAAGARQAGGARAPARKPSQCAEAGGTSQARHCPGGPARAGPASSRTADRPAARQRRERHRCRSGHGKGAHPGATLAAPIRHRPGFVHPLTGCGAPRNAVNAAEAPRDPFRGKPRGPWESRSAPPADRRAPLPSGRSGTSATPGSAPSGPGTPPVAARRGRERLR